MIVYIFYVKLNLTKTYFYIILIMKIFDILYHMVFIICLNSTLYGSNGQIDACRS